MNVKIFKKYSKYWSRVKRDEIFNGGVAILDKA